MSLPGKRASARSAVCLALACAGLIASSPAALAVPPSGLPPVPPLPPVFLPQVVTFDPSAPTLGLVGDSWQPAATSTSGLPVSFDVSSVNPLGRGKVCVINTFGLPQTVRFLQPGTCRVVGTAPGTPLYLPGAATLDIPVKYRQTIIFDEGMPTTGHVLDVLQVRAFSQSENPIQFSADPGSAGVCTVTPDGQVALAAIGTCTVLADEPGDSWYAPAPQVAWPITVTDPRATQLVAFTTAAPAPAYVGGTYRPVASSDAGLPVTVTADASTACSFAAGVVSFVGPGTCTLRASQAGDATHRPGSAVQVVPVVVVPAVLPVLPTPTAPPTPTPTPTPTRVVVLPPAAAVGAHGIGLPGAGLPGLGLGRHGDPVSVLQQLLRLAGADLGTERGTFGPRTKAALVSLVPGSHGRVDDAIVDALLVKVGRRFAPLAPGRGETVGLPTLTRGSRGADVVLCQSILVRLGFRPGPVDGAFGPRTRAAVQAYQRSRHLLADGVVGRQTWSALLSLR